MSPQIQGTVPTQVNRDPAIKIILQYQVNSASQMMQMPPLLIQLRRIQYIQVKHSLTNIQSFEAFFLGIDSPDMPTYANVDQVLIAPEYKGELYNQPTIAELTQHKWGLVTRKQMKQHISKNIKEIITNAQFR